MVYWVHQVSENSRRPRERGIVLMDRKMRKGKWDLMGRAIVYGKLAVMCGGLDLVGQPECLPEEELPDHVATLIRERVPLSEGLRRMADDLMEVDDVAEE